MFFLSWHTLCSQLALLHEALVAHAAPLLSSVGAGVAVVEAHLPSVHLPLLHETLRGARGRQDYSALVKTAGGTHSL